MQDLHPGNILVRVVDQAGRVLKAPPLHTHASSAHPCPGVADATATTATAGGGGEEVAWWANGSELAAQLVGL